MVGLGLQRHILLRRNYDLDFSLENVMYFELLRQGYQVNIGKINSDQLIKLQTFGLSEEEAEAVIVDGFLR